MSSCEHKYHEHFSTIKHVNTREPTSLKKTSNTLEFERFPKIYIYIYKHINIYIYISYTCIKVGTFQNPCASTCYISRMGSKSLHRVRSHLYKRAVFQESTALIQISDNKSHLYNLQITMYSCVPLYSYKGSLVNQTSFK